MSGRAVRRTIVMGAAGRDFHNFLVAMRDDPTVEVVAFTATQIPGIDDRTFPAQLAGERYPEGIPIRPESELCRMIPGLHVDEVVFAYSDVSHLEVMHKASMVLAAGADFRLMGPETTMLPSTKPVISVCAVRTGVGKSGISSRVIDRLGFHGLRTVDVRHPMPYRDLFDMSVERYASIEDLDRFGVTIEEREEFEQLVAGGTTVMAGVDYEAILRQAEREADVVLWDGGNNDLPFFRSDLEIVGLDPHRLGHETLYHPGETNFRRADVLVINKVNTAEPEAVQALANEAAKHAPRATLVYTDSLMEPEDPAALRGRRVLAVEDGPTVTHGGMGYGAAAIAALNAGAAELVEPAPFARGSLEQVYRAYPHMLSVLPAMGYSAEQLRDLEATIDASDADVVAIGTPIDLARLIRIDKPAIRVTYRVADHGSPTIDEVVDDFLRKRGLIE